MLIIETTAQENGAHRNQSIHGTRSVIPTGFEVVPIELESACMAVMPFFHILRDDGGKMIGFESVTPPTVTIEDTPTMSARMSAVEEVVIGLLGV